MREPLIGAAPPTQASERLLYAMIAATAVLLLARFYRIDADFPLGINWSGDLYTDEGWYANSAIRDYLFGFWYLDGDFNPILTMPLAQLIHRVAFSVLGMSGTTVRLVVALSTVATVVLTALIVRRHFGATAAALAALILAVSFPGFAFSRLGIVEPIGIAFVVGALYVADTSAGGSRILRLVAAALLVIAATMCKSTMVFAAPLVAYYAWLSGTSTREGIVLALASLALTVGAIGTYQLAVSHLYAADYAFFKSINFEVRQVKGITGIAINVVRKLGQMFAFGHVLFGLTLVLTGAALWLSPRFRKSPLVHVLVAYVAAYFVLLLPVWYGPPRYFLPLLVPTAALAAIATLELPQHLRERGWARMAAAPAALVALLVLVEAARIGVYLAQPRYTYDRMIAGVGELIEKRGGALRDTVVVGEMSDSLALRLGIRALNSKFGTVPLDERLKRYRPSYAILHVDTKIVEDAVRAAGGRMAEIGAWDVFSNYYKNGENVRLYSLEWPGAAGAPSTGP